MGCVVHKLLRDCRRGADGGVASQIIEESPHAQMGLCGSGFIERLPQRRRWGGFHKLLRSRRRGADGVDGFLIN